MDLGLHHLVPEQSGVWLHIVAMEWIPLIPCMLFIGGYRVVLLPHAVVSILASCRGSILHFLQRGNELSDASAFSKGDSSFDGKPANKRVPMADSVTVGCQVAPYVRTHALTTGFSNPILHGDMPMNEKMSPPCSELGFPFDSLTGSMWLFRAHHSLVSSSLIGASDAWNCRELHN